MVNQFKFSIGKTRNHFNNAITSYITKIRTSNNNPEHDDEVQIVVDQYFNRLLRKLETEIAKERLL